MDDEEKQHLALCQDVNDAGGEDKANAQLVETAPLFTSEVLKAVRDGQVHNSPTGQQVYPQYGVLGMCKAYFDGTEHATESSVDNIVYANMNAPWSTFICGSQGGGKSHTLSCLLENSFLPSGKVGRFEEPLTGIVFHYDKFSDVESHQWCEVAALCSSDIPVRVLVSPSNARKMQEVYGEKLKKLHVNEALLPKIIPLRISEKHLNISSMMSLMGLDLDSAHLPLYVGTLRKILRDMAEKFQGKKGLDYNEFCRRLKDEKFAKDQSSPLNLRLELIESFMPIVSGNGRRTQKIEDDPFMFQPGSLTIVDLSCPFVGGNDACTLFGICLSAFLGQRSLGGRVIALDEAHKFLTQAGEALNFTNQLISVICQQRHLASRIMIATQEPTLSPRLLDLCNVTVVHRFLSPAWFDVLKGHLAAVGLAKSKSSDGGFDIFQSIIKLRTGEALVFSPTAILDIVASEANDTTLSPSTKKTLQTLQGKYFRIRIRNRISKDGGKDIMASKEVKGST